MIYLVPPDPHSLVPFLNKYFAKGGTSMNFVASKWNNHLHLLFLEVNNNTDKRKRAGESSTSIYNASTEKTIEKFASMGY